MSDWEQGPEVSCRLRDQRRVLDRLAAARGRSIERVIVDVTAPTTGSDAGPKMQALLDELVTSEIGVTLLIAGTDTLAPTPGSRTRVLAALLSAGVVLTDPSGELHPTPTTVAIAQAAAAAVAIGADRAGFDLRKRSATRGSDAERSRTLR